ncbi:hypothetical protein NHQ30_003855 [Ciborinia camelliae]|nr:hypothetical protein NHQ30_003855 [Ciborinia camelliae]
MREGTTITLPSAYNNRPMLSPDTFVDIELGPIGPAPSMQVSPGRNIQFFKPSKKTPRRYYLIPIFILIAIIFILVGVIAFMANHPGAIGTPCPTQANITQHYTAVHTPNITRQIHNSTMTTTLSTKTLLGAQATSTSTPQSDIDPVAIASCLGVLENACAMKNPPTTFGQCDPLFVFFYCDLTDMMVFRGAMKLDADGSSPVCQPMKEFCSRAIPLNRIPLADVSP